MELSARNQLRGTVTNIKAGAVMAEVTVHVNPGDMTAAITDSSREKLHLKVGDEVSVIIKATEVLIGRQEN
jgi:molybdopterin-binding protein